MQTLVGVIPALPALSLGSEEIARLRRLRKRVARALEGDDGRTIGSWRFQGSGEDRRLLLSILPPERLRRLLVNLFDTDAFLSPHGLRSVTKRLSTPYQVPGIPGATISYEPAESTTAMYGGNSNWRGPVWFPINYLIIRALQNYDRFLGEEFTVEYPTGSGRFLALGRIAADLRERLVSIWLPDAEGRRPVYGETAKLQTDPAWKDNLLFFEYFHGEVGAGLGAMHQTGWTALVADLLLDADDSGSG